MNKIILVVFFAFLSLDAFEIEFVRNNSKPKDPNENFFMNSDRKVYRAMEPNILKASEPKIIKAIEPNILKAIKPNIIKPLENIEVDKSKKAI